MFTIQDIQMQYPTRYGRELRGPLAQAWVSSLGGVVRYDLPKTGETCLFSGTKIECLMFNADTTEPVSESTDTDLLETGIDDGISGSTTQCIKDASYIRGCELGQEMAQKEWDRGYTRGYRLEEYDVVTFDCPQREMLLFKAYLKGWEEGIRMRRAEDCASLNIR